LAGSWRAGNCARRWPRSKGRPKAAARKSCLRAAFCGFRRKAILCGGCAAPVGVSLQSPRPRVLAVQPRKFSRQRNITRSAWAARVLRLVKVRQLATGFFAQVASRASQLQQVEGGASGRVRCSVVATGHISGSRPHRRGRLWKKIFGPGGNGPQFMQGFYNDRPGPEHDAGLFRHLTDAEISLIFRPI
jgi:hypothetical protein